MADISIDFPWGADIALATTQVNEAVAGILPQLPPGTRIATKRIDPTVFPIIAYSLTSSSLSLTQLYDLAQYQLRPLLTSVNGVARVQTTGGAPEEYRVTVNPARLASYALTLADVARAIFYFSEYHELVRIIEHRAALIEAGKNRMRPVAMTTLAAIFTLLPLALALGHGSAMQQPLAVAIISGLVVQLPLALLVLPVIFDVLRRSAPHGAESARG